MVCLIADGEKETYLEGHSGCLSETVAGIASRKSLSFCPLIIKQNSPLNLDSEDRQQSQACEYSSIESETSA